MCCNQYLLDWKGPDRNVLEAYQNVKYEQYDKNIQKWTICPKYTKCKIWQIWHVWQICFILTFPNVLRMLFADATDTVSVVAKANVSQTEREYFEARRFRTWRLVHSYQVHMEMQEIHQKQACCHLTPPPARSLWSIIGPGGNNMSRLEIDCNMEAEWPLDCRRKAKKLKGALQGTGGACRNGGAETGWPCDWLRSHPAASCGGWMSTFSSSDSNQIARILNRNCQTH